MPRGVSQSTTFVEDEGVLSMVEIIGKLILPELGMELGRKGHIRPKGKGEAGGCGWDDPEGVTGAEKPA